MASGDRVRCNGFKLKGGRIRLDMKKIFLKLRLVRHWNRSLREAVAVSSLATFKARWVCILGKLASWKVLLITGRLDYMISKGPF